MVGKPNFGRIWEPMQANHALQRWTADYFSSLKPFTTVHWKSHWGYRWKEASKEKDTGHCEICRKDDVVPSGIVWDFAISDVCLSSPRPYHKNNVRCYAEKVNVHASSHVFTTCFFTLCFVSNIISTILNISPKKRFQIHRSYSYSRLDSGLKINMLPQAAILITVVLDQV